MYILLRSFLLLSLSSTSYGFHFQPNHQQKRAGISPLFTFNFNKPASKKADAVKNYFNFWNAREMDKAIAQFDENCTYEDTVYPGVFEGKAALQNHLYNVAEALPDSFQFVLDSISEDPQSGNVGVKWRVQSEGKDLPFTRGCSMYVVNNKGLIQSGFDVVEPAIKSGSVSLAILQTASKFIAEPIRVIPLIGWFLYCWLLFFSDTAPGVNAFKLDPETWLEVKDLSLNFWLVLPILNVPWSPVRHPGLEGIFNLVLAWAGLFFGFLSDGLKPVISRNFENEGKERTFEQTMLGAVVSAQFLTNAVLLPYLFTRQSLDKTFDKKSKNAVFKEDLGQIEQFGESKITPLLFGTIGIISIYWFLNGRYEEFGDISTRLDSLKEIIYSDRLTFSFLIDLLYFYFFQGWLVDDDLKRRGVRENEKFVLRNIGKFVPFFGMITYLLNRPELPSKNDSF